MRRADEEAFQQALKLSLDDQDERSVSYGHADEEALRSGLLRSIYDQGQEHGAQVISSSESSEDVVRDISLRSSTLMFSHLNQAQRKLALERANNHALEAGLTRSVYDFGSGDSGTPPISSASNDVHVFVERVRKTKPFGQTFTVFPRMMRALSNMRKSIQCRSLFIIRDHFR